MRNLFSHITLAALVAITAITISQTAQADGEKEVTASSETQTGDCRPGMPRTVITVEFLDTDPADTDKAVPQPGPGQCFVYKAVIVKTKSTDQPPLVNDIDQDGDGISDNIDACPNLREVYNDFLDDDGCPDEVEFPDRWIDATTPNPSWSLKLGRLTLGAFTEAYMVAGDKSTTPNGVVGTVFTIGAKRAWLEVTGGVGGGSHGIGWNLRGSAGLMLRLGEGSNWSFGVGAITSRWRYDREIEGNTTRYDRIMNGGYLALAHDFGPVEGRLSLVFGSEGHETKTEVKKSWPIEFGLGISKSYDFLK